MLILNVWNQNKRWKWKIFNIFHSLLILHFRRCCCHDILFVILFVKSYQPMLPIATRENQRRTISGADLPSLYVRHVSRCGYFSFFFLCVPDEVRWRKMEPGRTARRDYLETKSRKCRDRKYRNCVFRFRACCRNRGQYTQATRIDFDKRARRIAERARARVRFCAKCASGRARVERTCCLWDD